MLKKNIIYILFIGILFSCTKKEFQFDQGRVYGTTFHIKYDYSKNLRKEILTELKKVDYSLSTFNPNSTISKVNKNQETKLDFHFKKVVSKAIEIADFTEGYFDITVSPLVNAWGFGFKDQKKLPTKDQISEILKYVGVHKIKLTDNKLIKEDPRTIITTSAIAKGYAVDVVAEYLETKGIKNYLVEIGGELRVKGKNPEEKSWRIGITKPEFDPLALAPENIKVLNLNEIAVATSGNYRNYYEVDGKIYAHTINPITGGQSVSNLLSTTILAKDCMTADAFATAYMAMGYEKAKENIKKQKGIEVYLVYRDEDSNEIKLDHFKQ
jgi:thiamine biosynthesis lipoprotein